MVSHMHGRNQSIWAIFISFPRYMNMDRSGGMEVELDKHQILDVGISHSCLIHCVTPGTEVNLSVNQHVEDPVP